MEIKNTYIGIETPVPHVITEIAREAFAEEEKTDQELYLPADEEVSNDETKEKGDKEPENTNPEPQTEP